MKMSEARAYAESYWGTGRDTNTMGMVQRNRRSPRFVVGYKSIETTGHGTTVKTFTWTSDVDWESAIAKMRGELS